ncbi:MAG TPA: hypothetical protein VHG92_02230 [Afifellaceae bacterium]|nr:hypothetical protein [Afifellaceae bacterium]
MPTIASLILLLALVAPADPAVAAPMVLAQAEAPEEEPAAPGEEEEAAQPEDGAAEPPDDSEAQAPEEGEAQPEEGEAQTEAEAERSQESEAQPDAPEAAAEAVPAEDGAILRSTDALPEPVRETWQALVAAARTGDIERLRPVIEDQPEPPMVAFDDVGDPIAYLRSLSGDAEGREVLAILLEVLEAGFLHVDQGTPQEMYLWPYFARYPVEELTARQMVELFTLLTAGDYQDMLSYGAYIFFRVGIAPDGRWLFFVAGD